jgi:hypothetical protein
MGVKRPRRVQSTIRSRMTSYSTTVLEPVETHERTCMRVDESLKRFIKTVVFRAHFGSILVHDVFYFWPSGRGFIITTRVVR